MWQRLHRREERNAANESVGSIEGIYLNAKGALETVIAPVGGFLGVSAQNVGVKLS